jgi:cell division septation protein DedD
MAEEEFHEIQLNGKQLVFLFMAGTVAAVVIFLCGLMVGRNLRVPRLEAAAATTESTLVDPTTLADDLPPPVSTEGTKPATIGEELSYESLQAPKAAAEQLRDDSAPVVEKALEKPAVMAKAAPPAAKPAAASVTKAKEVNAPQSGGWTVQVQAVNSRQEADAIARRLSAKGYDAFVTQRESAGPAQYRIRIGNYARKQDAEAMKAVLERKEQFKPWVTH